VTASTRTSNARQPSAVRAVWLAAVLVVALWFLHTISFVLLAVATVPIAAITLNAPVTWLERRGLRRSLGLLACLAGIFTALAIALVVIVPRIVAEGVKLADGVPSYVGDLVVRGDRLLAHQPALRGRVHDQLERLAPSAGQIVSSVGEYSFSLVALLLLAVTLLAMTSYIVVNPRPLLAGLVLSTPERHRDAFERALVSWSRMVVAWFWTNVASGIGQAVVVGIVLSLLDVPGAIVWAGLAFLAAFVPQVGPYLAAIPPVLVALAIDPWTALWTLLFYVVLSELVGDVIMPFVRAETMDVHPAVLIVAVLALGSAFGLLGALLAAPLAGFAVVVWREFYLERQPADAQLDARVERMLDRSARTAEE
jgi:predicted PurR-regulated permease PerM